MVNKHLVRVLDFPMAEYPLKKMIECGIRDIMIVTGGENFGAVVKYFGSGSKWGELEITDVNRFYIKTGKTLIIRMSGWWSDCGTMESLIQTEELIKNDRLIPSVRS